MKQKINYQQVANDDVVTTEKKPRQRVVVYPTIERDYSKMKSIRIDRNTVIYANPNQPVVQAKKNFMSVYVKPIDKIQLAKK